ncbi:MAG: ribosomal protein S18-alanine N-acetyltransferase [Chromatiales bacterium]|nr:ribosomal protein S18-alanine N-acetyltransferase [Chromatiales bacterium]
MSACAKQALPEHHTRTLLQCPGQSDAEANIVMSPMTATDIADVHALECRVYAFPWSQTIIVDCINSGYQCWMIRQQNKVIAYAIMMLGSREGHLLNLCVAPDFRRCGYADYLVGFLSDVAIVQNAERMLLEVRASNHPAISLYSKLGFQQIGRRANYYPAATDREDALVFAKLL